MGRKEHPLARMLLDLSCKETVRSYPNTVNPAGDLDPAALSWLSCQQ